MVMQKPIFSAAGSAETNGPSLELQRRTPKTKKRLSYQAIFMLSNILNSCKLFARRECPQQQLMEKLCLFPQLSTVEEIERICSGQCCSIDVLCAGNATEILTQIQQAKDDASCQLWRK
jgi:hypothetical protein